MPAGGRGIFATVMRLKGHANLVAGNDQVIQQAAKKPEKNAGCP